MNCLLTGATGFLGKHVLERLLSEPKIQEIHVVSRRAMTHPNPRVKVHQADLARPWFDQSFSSIISKINVIIHLAGHYKLQESAAVAYENNVFPMINLVEWLQATTLSTPPLVLYASTYVVRNVVEQIPSSQEFSGNCDNGETPIHSLLKTANACSGYAYSKAIAEKCLYDSYLHSKIFRLGVLVGNSKNGLLDKIDGPYYFLRLLSQLRKVSSYLPRLPLPANPSVLLPLVPVDIAAKILVDSIFMKKEKPGPEIHGLYHPKSLSVSHFVQACLNEISIKSKPFYLNEIQDHTFHWIRNNKLFYTLLKRIPSHLANIPHTMFDFTLKSMSSDSLENPNFKRNFGDTAVPHFQEYSEIFFKGFKESVRIDLKETG